MEDSRHDDESTLSPVAVRLTAALLLPLVVALACTRASGAPVPTTTTPTTTTTTVPPTSGLFCKIWKIRHPKGPDGLPAPAPKPYIYDLDVDTVVHARPVEQRGTDCQDPAARVQMFDGEIIGSDLYFPATNTIDGLQMKPTPYSQTLAPGQAQASTVEIASLNIERSLAGIRIYGSLRITINGAVSIVAFDGTYLDLHYFFGGP